MNILYSTSKIATLILFLSFQCIAADAVILPKLSINDIQYQGAFRVKPLNTSLDYTRGIIDVNKGNHSLFIVSGTSIGEYEIPKAIISNNLLELNVSSNRIQPFRNVFNSESPFNNQKLDRISGIKLLADSKKLVVNALQYYDGNADNTDTTIILEDALKLETSAINGNEFKKLEGAVHAAGWVSEIPTQWQTITGTDAIIFGHASNVAINGRNSMGPTAFLVKKSELLSGATNTPSTALIDFSLDNFLYKEEAYNGTSDWNTYGYNTTKLTYNTDGTVEAEKDADGNVITIGNDLWTELSKAKYGFIVPGTSTYAVFGSSGGHDSGIGYKITPSDGKKCGGPCAYKVDDYYNYYWFWDVNDLVKALNKEVAPHDVRPYAYGKFEMPFQIDKDGEPQFSPIGGGSYDASTSTLYLTLQNAGKVGNYDSPPLFLKYFVDIPQHDI